MLKGEYESIQDFTPSNLVNICRYVYRYKFLGGVKSEKNNLGMLQCLPHRPNSPGPLTDP